MPRISRARPRSRLRTFVVGCGIGCATVVLALLIVFVIVYSKVTAVPDSIARRPGSVSASQPPSPGGAPAPPTPSIDEQAQTIRKAVESGQPAPVALRINESQLNALIAENTGSSGPVRDLRVALRDADLLATGLTTWAGRQVYLTAQLRPQAVNGRLHLRVDSLRAGNLRLPGSAVSRLQAEIDRGMSRSKLVDERVYIEEAVVSRGELVISGHTTPR